MIAISPCTVFFTPGEVKWNLGMADCLQGGATIYEPTNPSPLVSLPPSSSQQ